MEALTQDEPAGGRRAHGVDPGRLVALRELDREAERSGRECDTRGPGPWRQEAFSRKIFARETARGRVSAIQITTAMSTMMAVVPSIAARRAATSPPEKRCSIQRP